MGTSRKASESAGNGADTNGYEAFDISLGDLMRGERATMGKSLLDVEKELKIKAVYISAIENADAEAFETPGFIPGYVRSYARYLDMDPDKTFAVFCAESGFSPSHGMSASSAPKRNSGSRFSGGKGSGGQSEHLFKAGTPFAPEEEGFLARLELAALGSTAVLLALIAVIGYGAWSVLNEVQRVNVTPTENAPEVLSDLDPVTGREPEETDSAGVDIDDDQSLRTEKLDRLYRPQALEVPVMVARDAPISTLDPSSVGALPQYDQTEPTLANATTTVAPGPNPVGGGLIGPIPVNQDVAAAETTQSPQVVESARPNVQLVSVRPAWVRVRSADGSTLFEGIMNAGETFDVPETENPPILKVGESGAVYFAVGNQMVGPAGNTGSVTSNITLSPDTLRERYQVADMVQDEDLSRYVAELALPGDTPQPQQSE